jgi:hypothetical protein
VPERAGKTYTATVQSLAQAIAHGVGCNARPIERRQRCRRADTRRICDGALRDACGRGRQRPPGALIFGKDGVRVATLDAGNRVRIRTVTIARDLGNVVQLAGVPLGTRIIDSPPDGIANGDLVRIAAVDKKASHEAPEGVRTGARVHRLRASAARRTACRCPWRLPTARRQRVGRRQPKGQGGAAGMVDPLRTIRNWIPLNVSCSRTAPILPVRWRATSRRAPRPLPCVRRNRRH